MPAKILVVDDVPLHRRVLTSLLQPEGYVFLEAGNSYEACSLLKQNADRKNIPIIFIAGIHDESFKVKRASAMYRGVPERRSYAIYSPV